jgi:hypothetical protein
VTRHADREHRDAGLEPERRVLAPWPVGALERLDRHVHLPHAVGYLAKTEPGRLDGARRAAAW